MGHIEYINVLYKNRIWITNFYVYFSFFLPIL